MNKEYLGDSVYVQPYAGGGVELFLDNGEGGKSFIAIEPEVKEALDNYWNRMMREQNPFHGMDEVNATALRDLHATPKQVESFARTLERWKGSKISLPYPMIGDCTCLMVDINGGQGEGGMTLGIEKDGYTHS